MEPDRGAIPKADAARRARRLLWGLILGIVVLNLFIFLATMRHGASEGPEPAGSGSGSGGAQANAP